MAMTRLRRLPIVIAALALTSALAVAVASGADAESAPEAPQQGGAPAGPAALPDLTIQYLQVTLETGGACNYSSTNLGIRVYFANIGDADAGPFDVEINNVWHTYGDGLAAGEEGSLWAEGYVYSGINTATVDVEEEIVESDETNNHLEDLLAVPTLPPTCTPTPSITPTQTPTQDRPKLLGDVDCDFAITSLDALFVLQYVAVLIDELPCPDAADISLDGEVNAVDAAIMLQVVAGLLGLF